MGRLRRLQPSDLPALSRLLARDVVLSAYLRSELRLGASDWWGVDARGGLTSVLLDGSLAVPWISRPDDAPLLAEAVGGRARAGMIVGPRDSVLALHEALPSRRRPREVRDRQPVLVIDRQGLAGANGNGSAARAPVRRARRCDLGPLTLAAAAMHREEMGVDPLAVDPAGWRTRMTTLVERGWSHVWMEGGEVVFKAELSAWTPEAVQLQGVYTAPAHRRRGVARAALAALCGELLGEVALCTLYANSHNTAALHLYEGLGFRRWGEYATVIY